MAATKQPYHLPKDAVWFITGCSSGIGKALSALIASTPSQRLVATARNVSAMAHLPDNDDDDDQPAEKRRVLKLALDVTSPAAIDAAVAAALARFGRLDVVVNNAGYALRGDTENAALADARRLVDTNFWGAVGLTTHAMRIMREENPKNGIRGGVVLNIASLGGRVGFAGNSFYHASKFALEGWTQAVSKEMRPEWNIHFCLVEPGGVATDYNGRSTQSIPVHPAYAAADTPTRALVSLLSNKEFTKRWASPDLVAAAMFLAVAGGDASGSGSGSGASETGATIPLHLPLGMDAWKLIKSELESALEDHERQRERACGTMTDQSMVDSLRTVLN